MTHQNQVVMKKKKMKVSELLSCYDGISILIDKKVDLPSTLGMDLALTKMNIEKHVTSYNGERGKLLAKYGTQKGDNQFDIKMSDLPAFEKEIDSMLEKEHSVEIFEGKIKKEELNGAKLPIQFFEVFKPFIET